MTRAGLITVVAPTIVAAFAASASAGIDGRLVYFHGDCVVVTITKVSDHPPTNGNPARVDLEIHELLNGDRKIDRRRAVWEPVPHDIDYGGGAERDGKIKAWLARPTTAPRPGGKFIVWGESHAHEGVTTFWVQSWRVYPYSEETRDWAITAMCVQEQMIWTEMERRRLEREEFERAVADRRAKVTTEDIGEWVKKAEFVGLAVQSGGARETATFSVEKILKGRKLYKYVDDSYFVKFPVDAETVAALDSDAKYYVFLGDRTLDSQGAAYRRVGPGDGMVLADAASRKAVEAALRASPPAAAPGPLAVINVIGAPTEEAWNAMNDRFEKAAAGRCEFVRSRMYYANTGVAMAAGYRTVLPELDVLIVPTFEADGAGGKWSATVIRATGGKIEVIHQAARPGSAKAEDLDCWAAELIREISGK